MRSSIVGATLALLLALAGSGVAADDRPAVQAREHFNRGTQLYDIGEYRQALAEYKAAYLAKPDPVHIFNIAQCHRKLGDRAEALDRYRTYLRRSPGASNRGEVERIIAELERPAPSTTSPGAVPPVAATQPVSPVGTPPPPPSAQAPPPPPAYREALSTAPPASPAAAAAPPVAAAEASPSTPLHRRWWFWAGAGVVIVTAVVAGVALSRSDRPGCPGGVECLP